MGSVRQRAVVKVLDLGPAPLFGLDSSAPRTRSAQKTAWPSSLLQRIGLLSIVTGLALIGMGSPEPVGPVVSVLGVSCWLAASQRKPSTTRALALCDALERTITARVVSAIEPRSTRAPLVTAINPRTTGRAACAG